MKETHNHILKYSSPASEWVEALPTGNGHMGAMSFGNGLYELYEATCWSGCREENPIKESASSSMQKARNLLSEYRIAEAESVLNECLGMPRNYGTQLPLGRLRVQASDGKNSEKLISRSLNLYTATAQDNFTLSDINITRDEWISNPSKIMAVRLTASAPIPSVMISLEGWSNPSKTDMDTGRGYMITRGIALENIHSDGLHGVSYCIQLTAETDGTIHRARDGMRIEGAKYITVFLSSACNLFGADAYGISSENLKNALKSDYDSLLSEHISDVEGTMKSSILSLPDNKNSCLDTDDRIRAYRNDDTDYSLISLFYQYGRYLLFISSRCDSILPAALQGILNDNRACRMGWTDDMHLDINTEMNYYPAESTGLGDTIIPLARWLRDVLMPEGEKIAKNLYSADGWCAHTISNAHGWAAPGWAVSWGFFVSGGAWAATAIWEHWLYTHDIDFLEEYFCVLKGCAEFYHSVLTEDTETGRLVVNPSYSPENHYLTDDGYHAMTVGSTADTSIAKYILSAVIEGAEALGISGDEYNAFRQDLSRLPEFQIDDIGRLQEWIKPYRDANPDHRHLSHLTSLQPLGLIDPKKNPELGDAVRRVLEERLGENARDIVLANWAGANLILMNARLYDGEASHHYIHPMIGFLSRMNMLITHEGPTDSETGGIYELDGNTGLTAGIAEMLIQNRRDRTDILPAIPSEWKTGEITGLKTYGGHECNVVWDEKTITVTLLGHSDGKITLSYRDSITEPAVKSAETTVITFER